MQCARGFFPAAVRCIFSTNMHSMSDRSAKGHIFCMASPTQCTRSMRALKAAFRTFTTTSSTTLPAFLVPALARSPPTQRAHFSTTRLHRSKIGSLPLSLPPEVTFDIITPPPVKQGKGISRNEPSSRVEITGPLGKLGVEIPPYMSIAVDEAAKTRRLSVLDQTDKKQKAMWGVYALASIAQD